LNYVLFLPIETGDNITYATLNHSKKPQDVYALPTHVRTFNKPPQGPPPGPPPLPPRLTQKRTQEPPPLSKELHPATNTNNVNQTGGLRHKSKRTKKNTKRN
jgi:hypothetical protein